MKDVGSGFMTCAEENGLLDDDYFTCKKCVP